jgi:excisionase family DNA binding protein
MSPKIKLTKKREFLKTSQAAEMLNISISTFKKLVHTRKLKVAKTPGGHYRISRKYLLDKFCNQGHK